MSLRIRDIPGYNSKEFTMKANAPKYEGLSVALDVKFDKCPNCNMVICTCDKDWILDYNQKLKMKFIELRNRVQESMKVPCKYCIMSCPEYKHNLCAECRPTMYSKFMEKK